LRGGAVKSDAGGKYRLASSFYLANMWLYPQYRIDRDNSYIRAQRRI